MHHFKLRLLPTLVASAIALPAVAADPFQLGTVEVVGKASPTIDTESTVTSDTLEKFNRDTVGAAVALVPGMSVSHNSRNEDIVYLRGFDVRQVPLFIDGIPTYVPYDGYVDFGRFTTFDLSEIRVAKGAASLLYGPNVLGGAINLVTRKPTRPFEGDVRMGFGSGGEKRVAANIGSNQGSWYFQAGTSYLDADNFPLSADYKSRAISTSAKNSTPMVVEDGSQRENSYRTDKKVSLKIGITPNTTDEFALGYVKQEGEKGNPPYAGAAPGTLGTSVRYWRWPYWNVESVYALGNFAVGKDHIVKLRVYDDTYRNGIDAYTNGTYTTQLNNTSFPSRYNDGSRGASAELASYLFANHELRVAYHFKEDRHNEWNPNIADKNFKDVTTSFAVEDAINLAPDWRLRLGASHDRRETKEAETYTKGDVSKNNGLAELTHTLGDTEIYGSVAKKSRFPTIKDRYSFKLGSALYNPALEPETASNMEIGIRSKPWQGAVAQAAVFHSRIEDAIQSVVVTAANQCASGPTPNVTCNQMQNVGTARHEGIELSLEQQWRNWSAGVNYTYMDRVNISNPAIPLTDTPRHKLFAHLGWKPANAWEFEGTVDSEDGRTVTYGNGYTRLGGFTLLGAKALWKPRKDTSIELGVANLLDQNYELSDGYPMPGRTFFANMKYSF
ncbi:TonB-dependent receptor [Rhodoferax sp.]|uniref:TonB-dependent receptor plug domain-containing protein n=1 Tax=Rhodoferax sp. TaxID=50421 RepID=UPI00284AD112|nr:TonB-dependent receptor [Rhodoferax sp.]MDR3369347.1 TonB-dependent receptor [Rhodoferax sp.]